MPRVVDVVQLAQGIITSPQGRQELVRLASALNHIYLACMAKLMETPPENGYARQPEETDCRLIAMPQVADILGLPEHTVREMGRRGLLPTVHVGARVLVSLASLKRFIRENETNGNGLHQSAPGEIRPRLPRRVR